MTDVRRLLVLAVLLPVLIGRTGASDELRLGGPKYDAMLSLEVLNASTYEYQLKAPLAIEGMPFAVAALIYAKPVIVDGHEITGPLIKMVKADAAFVGAFRVPEPSREPEVWVVAYYGEIGVDKPSLRAYALVIDSPPE